MCGGDVVDAELLQVLEDIREYFGCPVVINSGFRCWIHNKREGGSATSQHLLGKAADIVVIGVHADVVAHYLERIYPDKYGIGRYLGRTHIDVRQNKARWDMR